MKIQIALLAAALLAGCAQDSGNAESDVAATPASSNAATAPAQPSPSAGVISTPTPSPTNAPAGPI